MDHRDHVELLQPAVDARGGTWADIGSGRGAFTLALAELLGPGAEIVSVDRDQAALRDQAAALATRFPSSRLRQLVADFRRPLELPPLDGLVMANALHFVSPAEQVTVVRSLAEHLRPLGRFVLVEYEADRGNQWVPHPLPYSSWETMARRAGLADVRRIGRVPSRFLGAIYAALAEKPPLSDG